MFWQALQSYVVYYILLHICSSLFSLHQKKIEAYMHAFVHFFSQEWFFPASFLPEKKGKLK